MRELEGAVKAGTLSEADINARAAEVAKVAAATKLVGVGRNDLLKDDIAAAHHDVARKVAEGSSVLLKNDNATLAIQGRHPRGGDRRYGRNRTLSGFRLLQGKRHQGREHS
ncbi:MAG: hypothetical protein ACLUAM_08460 [Bifidobacterium adolescentis]